MFALANNKKLENKVGTAISTDIYELSPSLCKIYEKSLTIDFFNKENRSFLKFNFKSPSELNESNKETKFTIERHLFALNDPKQDQMFHKQLHSRLNLRLNAFVERFTLALNDDNILSSSNQIEILRLTSERVCLCVKKFDLVASSLMSVNLKCMSVQLDNQMFDNESDMDAGLSGQQLKYDFPVVFLPREETKVTNWARFSRSFDQIRALKSVCSDSTFLNVKLILAEQEANLFVPTSLEIDAKPFDVYIEDYLLYNLIQIFIDYFDHLTTIESPTSKSSGLTIESDDDLAQLVKPLLLIHKFKISSIDSLVNLETKLKIYLATYKMPIKFEKFELNGLPFQQLTTKHFIRLFTNHYLTALIFRVGWLLGSLDLIGSPTVFIQQASNGLYDFMFMPYKGLRAAGANGLLSGFSSGSLSLLRNLSAGTITSLTSFASFISRNMDVLSFDQNHLIRQDQIRHEMFSPQALAHSNSPNFLLNVSTSFIITIMGAIGGLAEQPMQSIVNSESIIKGKSNDQEFVKYLLIHSILISVIKGSVKV
jgi:vacuolar protein sorting-associated protein 13B